LPILPVAVFSVAFFSVALFTVAEITVYRHTCIRVRQMAGQFVASFDASVIFINVTNVNICNIKNVIVQYYDYKRCDDFFSLYLCLAMLYFWCKLNTFNTARNQS